MKTRITVVSLIKVGKIFDSKTLCEINIQNLLVKYENVLKSFPSELKSPMSLPMNFSDFIFSRSSESSPQSQTNRSPPVVNDYPPKSHRWTTEVASAAFAVATGSPPVAHRWEYFVMHTQYWKIVMRNCDHFVDRPAFTSALSALRFCLFCLSYLCSAAMPTSRLADTRCQNCLYASGVTF